MPACAVMSVKRIGPDGRAEVEAVSDGFAGWVEEDAAGDEGSPTRAGGLEAGLQPATMSSKQYRNKDEEDLKSVPWMQQSNYGWTGFACTIVVEAPAGVRREFIHISNASAIGPTMKSA
jgi:hypothetical protein